MLEDKENLKTNYKNLQELELKKEIKKAWREDNKLLFTAQESLYLMNFNRFLLLTKIFL